MRSVIVKSSTPGVSYVGSSSTGTTKQWALADQHTDLVAGLTPDGKQVSSSTAYGHLRR
ncbi:hypothetical protein ACWGIY_31265 [Streptomyces sp. NPDC054878]